jgi:hypothetical protein
MPADASPERSARLSKNHPRYARTYTLLDQTLPNRAPSSPGTPRLPKAPSIVARKRHFVEQFQADLGHPVSRAKIFRFSSPPNQWLFLRRPVSTRGADRASSRTRDGMRWTRQRQARKVFAGRLSVSEHGAQDDRRCSVRQNRVVLAPVAGVQAVGGELDPTGSIQPSSRQRWRQDEFVSRESAA